jgi:two-component system NtrC family sensor kinase
MNSPRLGFKVLATVLLTSLLVVIGVLNLRDRASWTDPWDGVFWEESANHLRAAEVARDGPGAAAGIRVGDALVAINGRNVANLGQYFSLLDEYGVSALATYRVQFSGAEARDVTVQISGRELLAAKDAVRIILAFLHLGIGLFVALRAVGSRRSFHFFLICLAAFVAFLYSYTPRLGGLDLTVYWLSVAAVLLLPALFLHFCLRFPIDRVDGASRAPLLYIPVALLGLFRLLWISGRLVHIGLPTTAQASQLIDRFDLVYLCGGFFAGATLLWKRRTGAADLTTQQQMKWVTYGTLAGALPFTLFYALPYLLGVRPNLAMEAAALSLGLIPLAFVYAIIHYRLLDVEVIVRRGAAYLIASAFLLATYLFLTLFLGKALEWVVPEAGFALIAAAALALALLFAPVRDRIQGRLDRFFYKDRFDDRAGLLDFARMLTSEISLGRLSRSILERVTKTFQIERAALLLAEQQGRFRLTDEMGVDVSADSAVSFEENEIFDSRTSSDLPGLPTALRRAGAGLAAQGLHYVQELNLRGRRIGLIALGRLPHGDHFSTEDLELLGALAGYAAIALENANLYRSIEIKALELERLKIYTENIIESIDVAVLVLDLDGKITSCNRAFEKLYDVTRAQILDTPVTSLLSADVLSSIHGASGSDGWQVKEPSSIYKLFVQNRRGENLICNCSVVPMLDSYDTTTGCVLVLDDITQKVRLENQLLQAEKLSSIGLLAAGIAHEVNTPITGISSFTQMLLKETPADDRRVPILQKIEKQTFRAAEIVNGLLNFARMNGSEYRDLDVNQVIQDSLSLLEHQLCQNHILVAKQLTDGLPDVYANAGKLQQVFVNLFLNARDAMPSGGRLEISSSMNETMVLVDIRDTGVGISEGDIKRIYDPFFTTKTTGKGTGLGLAVTYGIIQEHGGRIFVDSSPGTGTHFRLKLPTRQIH